MASLGTPEKSEYELPTIILLDPKFADRQEIENSVSRLFTEARNILRQYVPEWLPKEPSRLVVLNTNARQGEYIGKWDNAHSILITLSDNQLIGQRREEVVFTIMHELLHQRVAEILSIDDINGIGISEKIEKMGQMPMFADKSDFERAEILAFSGGANASPLQKVINEGFAVWLEIKVLEMIINNNEAPDNQKKVARELLIERQQSLKPLDQIDQLDTYSLGYKLVGRLIDFLREKNIELDQILRGINWEDCGRIRGIDEIKRMINEPSRFPLTLPHP